MIRLGYEEFLTNPVNSTATAPSAWFFGRQGDRKFEVYSDFVYRDIKAGKNTEHTRWYFREEQTLHSLEWNSYSDKFEVGLYKDFIERDETFLVPIRIVSHYQDIDFKYLHSARFPEDLLNYIHAGKATVVFYTFWEGNIDSVLYSHIEAFISNNGLSRDEVWVATSSLRRDIVPSYSDRNFGVFSTNYFGQDLWFLPGGENKLNPLSRSRYESDLERFRSENLTRKKSKTFLCLNRRLMPHRAFIASFISSHPEIRNNSLYSFGIGVQYLKKDELYTDFTNKDILNYIGSWVWDKYRDNAEIVKIENYLDTNKDQSALVVCDKFGDPLQVRENPVEMKEELYRTTFVNVITETFADSRGYQFITEKTMKTLYAQMPFIAVAPAGFLETLHRLGFKTFENYWDESYDMVEDDYLRYLCVCRIMEELNTKSKQELFEMTRDMVPILYHNAKLVSSCQDVEETFSFFEKIQNRSSKKGIKAII